MLTARSAFVVPIIHLLLTVRAPAQSAVRVSKGEMVEVAVVAPGTAREERSLRARSLPFTAADASHF